MPSGELADATIVFDLDGTLVDTAPDLTRALNETLDLEGLAHASPAAVRAMVGQGARQLIARATQRAGAAFSAERLDQLTNAYIEFYRADIAGASKIFPGVEAAMDEMAALGAKFAVCTNKRTDLSLLLLDALGLSPRFSAIVGADAVAQRKPHPDHFRAAVTRAGGVVRRAIMIGDSAADVGAARGAGAPVALVRFGYSEEDVEHLGADVLLDDYLELTTTCRRLLAARA